MALTVHKTLHTPTPDDSLETYLKTMHIH